MLRDLAARASDVVRVLSKLLLKSVPFLFYKKLITCVRPHKGTMEGLEICRLEGFKSKSPRPGDCFFIYIFYKKLITYMEAQ